MPLFQQYTFQFTIKKHFRRTVQSSDSLIQTEIADMVSKIKAGEFEPKKGNWECTQCDTIGYATNQMKIGEK
jgi:hypothetical protein